MATKPLTTLAKKIGTALMGYAGWGNSNDFYVGASASSQRIGNKNLNKDIIDLISEHKHRMMISDSRYIYQSNSIVSGAVMQKASKVYGGSWKLQHYSADRDFANAVEKDIENLDSILDIRGGAYGFRRNIKLESKTLDVDGEFFVILTESRNGTPQLQYVEAHNVDTCNEADKASGIVGYGTYKELKIKNGVIYNEYMRPVAYRFKDSSSKVGYRDISARDVCHIYDPAWFSQGRGTPSVANAILDWYDLAETRDAEKLAQKINSSISLIESNESGRFDAGNALINPQGQAGKNLQTQLFEGGMIRYIKNGGNLKAHDSARPSDGWLKFTKQIEQGAFYGLGWRREMLDSSDVGGAGVRAFVRDINDSINDRCEILKKHRMKILAYVIAKRAKQGMYKLPEDWLNFGFTKPREFIVDEGNIRKADLEDLRAGLVSEVEILSKRGLDPDEFYRKRAEGLVLKKQIADEYGLDLRELGTLEIKPDQPTSAVEESDEQDG